MPGRALLTRHKSFRSLVLLFAFRCRRTEQMSIGAVEHRPGRRDPSGTRGQRISTFVNTPRLEFALCCFFFIHFDKFKIRTLQG